MPEMQIVKTAIASSATIMAATNIKSIRAKPFTFFDFFVFFMCIRSLHAILTINLLQEDT